jgi:phage terminase Nu1 subunit (DNA packaging protein)
MIDLGFKVSQAEFGNMVGISQQAVSQCVQSGVLTPGGDCAGWLREYCSNLREVAAGRAAGGSLDLATERALLAREQREGQRIRNAIARGSYASIDLLSDVLANASQSVVDRLDQIPAAISRVCPDLPLAVRDAVMTEIASARNEMVRKTVSLVADTLDAGDSPVENAQDDCDA